MPGFKQTQLVLDEPAVEADPYIDRGDFPGKSVRLFFQWLFYGGKTAEALDENGCIDYVIRTEHPPFKTSCSDYAAGPTAPERISPCHPPLDSQTRCRAYPIPQDPAIERVDIISM
jgi:hypothetical protein